MFSLQNVRQALALARMSDISSSEFPGIVRNLKLQQTKDKLDKIEAELEQKVKSTRQLEQKAREGRRRRRRLVGKLVS